MRSEQLGYAMAGSSQASGALVLFLAVYVLYPLFLLLITRKRVIMWKFRYMQKLCIGKNCYDCAMGENDRKRGLQLLIASWIMGIISLTALFAFKDTAYEFPTLVLSLVLTMIVEVTGGMIYSFAVEADLLRDEGLICGDGHKEHIPPAR